MPLLTRGGVEPESIPSLHLGSQDATGLGQGRSTKKREMLERSTITNRHSDPLLNPQPGRVGRFAPMPRTRKSPTRAPNQAWSGWRPSGRLLDCPPHHLRNSEMLPKQWGRPQR
jgi:hypothetical protein